LGLRDPTSGGKKLLSRSSRYSGLLNILTTVDLQFGDEMSLANFLYGCDAWLVLDIPRDRIVPFAKAASSAGVKRTLFTVRLPEDQISTTALSEFDEAAALFSAAGGQFTGMRHGTIVEGTEDGPYSIVNASTPCSAAAVKRGVLARVATELLRTEDAYGTTCGLSSAGAFEAAYLSILRSTGLTRQQEVRKVFTGGIARVAELTAREREAEVQRQLEEKDIARKRQVSAIGSRS
jgi:hypothetical protein